MSKRHDKRQKELYTDIQKKGLTVSVRTNSKGESDIGSALKILKKRLNREGIPKEMREREYYESKGEIRRRKKAEAIRRHKKALQENITDF